ncbi:MAG TPA: DUF4383 domain-containing protein [Methylomirabilota bacterium]
MTSRNFAMVLGVIYIVVGVLGFVRPLVTVPADAPPLAFDQGYGYLFGLFPVNILHNLVHLAIGVWGVLAARTFPAARTFAASVAIIFGVLTVMGFIPQLNTVFGLIPLFGHDIWLHALTAIAGAYFGFGERRMADELRDRTRRAA